MASSSSSSPTPVVSIESPYNNVDDALRERNIRYAILCMKDASLNHNEAAYASHLLNTQTVINGRHLYVSDDTFDPFDHDYKTVIAMTHAIRARCDKIVFYVDFGMSSGMKSALDLANEKNIPTEERHLPADWLAQHLNRSPAMDMCDR